MPSNNCYKKAGAFLVEYKCIGCGDSFYILLNSYLKPGRKRFTKAIQAIADGLKKRHWKESHGYLFCHACEVDPYDITVETKEQDELYKRRCSKCKEGKKTGFGACEECKCRIAIQAPYKTMDRKMDIKRGLRVLRAVCAGCGQIDFNDVGNKESAEDMWNDEPPDERMYKFITDGLWERSEDAIGYMLDWANEAEWQYRKGVWFCDKCEPNDVDTELFKDMFVQTGKKAAHGVYIMFVHHAIKNRGASDMKRIQDLKSIMDLEG